MRLCCIGVWRRWSAGPMYRSIDVCHHSSARWCCKQCRCHAWLCTVESRWTAVSVTGLHVAVVFLSCVTLFLRVANISAEMTPFLFTWIFRIGFNRRMFVRSQLFVVLDYRKFLQSVSLCLWGVYSKWLWQHILYISHVFGLQIIVCSFA